MASGPRSMKGGDGASVERRGHTDDADDEGVGRRGGDTKSDRVAVPFGEHLRRRRRACGLTLEVVASRAGCSRSYLSTIETGRRGPPGAAILRALEEAMGLPDGELRALVMWSKTPVEVRAELERTRAQRQAADELKQLIGADGVDEHGSWRGALDAAYRTGRLVRLVDVLTRGSDGASVVLGPGQQVADPAGHVPSDGGVAEGMGQDDAGARAGTRTAGPSGSPAIGGPVGLDVLEWAHPGGMAREIPLINKVAAGYPSGFTDLGYPARIADEYVRCPDVSDPDAFAARVVGDSMEPDYREGDVIVFSPSAPIVDGSDCFVRLEPDHESTFKRVYFEGDAGCGGTIRLQPLNSRYGPRVLAREDVAGLYSAVSVIRSIRRPGG